MREVNRQLILSMVYVLKLFVTTNIELRTTDYFQGFTFSIAEHVHGSLNTSNYIQRERVK
jgi:hypothetical protein